MFIVFLFHFVLLLRRVVVGKHTVAESLADTDVQVIAPPVRFACDVANALEKGDAEPFTRALDHKSFDKMLVSIDTAPKPCIVVATNAGSLALALVLAYRYIFRFN